MQVSFKFRNVEAVQKYLRTVGRGLMRVGLYAVAEYIIGNGQHGLKHAEPYKYVSRADAYGSTGATFENGNPVPDGYFSASQYRYVMAKLASGEMKIGDYRTGVSTESWQYVETGSKGYGVTITNPEEGAYFTRDDYGQARQPAAVGWRKVSTVIADNIKGAMRHADAEIRKYLQGLRSG